MKPAKLTLNAYQGDDFSLLIAFEDSESAAFDLSGFTDIIWTIYNPDGSQAEQFKKSEGDLSITGAGNNVLNSSALTAEKTAALTTGEYDYDIELDDGTNKITYLSHVLRLSGPGRNLYIGETNDTVVVNQATNTITVSESLDAAAKAVAAQVAAEAAKTAAESAESGADSAATAAQTAQQGAQTAASNTQALADNFDNDFDITGLSEGDILIADATPKLVRADPAAARDNLGVYSRDDFDEADTLVNNPAAIYNSQYTDWDSYKQYTTGDRLDGKTMPSGQAWNNWTTNGFYVDADNGFIIPEIASEDVITIFQRSDLGISDSRVGNGCIVEARISTGAASSTGLVIGKDVNNYLKATISSNKLTIGSVVGGVETELASTTAFTKGGVISYVFSKMYLFRLIYQPNYTDLGRFSVGFSMPELNIEVYANFEANNPFPNLGDAQNVGFFANIHGSFISQIGAIRVVNLSIDGNAIKVGEI